MSWLPDLDSIAVSLYGNITVETGEILIITKEKIETHIDSTHIQEGYSTTATSAVRVNNDILRAVKVSAPLRRGVTAPVSVSEQKIQIIILILKRGPCLHCFTVSHL